MKKAPDKAELVLTLGAIWLAFRGEDPTTIASSALRSAAGVRKMLQRLEELGDQHIRATLGCKAPDPCDCLYCEAKQQEIST